MKTIHALELAQVILSLYPDQGISPMKLQKLAYYAKVWLLVTQQQPHINAQFKKWAYGPVNQEIYIEYKRYGSEYIPAGGASVHLTESQKEIIKFILDNYVDYSAFALSAMTHNEDPWVQAEANGIITDEAIHTYYSKQLFAKNFATKPGKESPFYVLKSNSWHSFTLDMNTTESEALSFYSSWEELQQQKKKAGDDFKKLLCDFEKMA